MKGTFQKTVRVEHVFCPNCGDEHTMELKQAFVDGSSSGTPSASEICDCGFCINVKGNDPDIADDAMSITGYEFMDEETAQEYNIQTKDCGKGLYDREGEYCSYCGQVIDVDLSKTVCPACGTPTANLSYPEDFPGADPKDDR